MEKINSQQEADKAFEELAKDTSTTLNISLDEARRRLTGLYHSGILDTGSPDDPRKQTEIDAFLMIPSSTYEHLN